MKTVIILWLFIFLFLLALAYLSKETAINRAKKVMKAKQWPPPEFFNDPQEAYGVSLVDAVKKPLHGVEAIRAARSSVIMSDIFMWCVIWSFILFGLLFLEV